MKKIIIFFFLFSALIINSYSQSVKGMSLNGATGLISIPSARIGWEKTTDLGVDIGHHSIFADSETNHISKVSVSLLKFAELAAAYDSQYDSDNADLLINAKLQLPVKSASAVAVGVNLQNLKQSGNKESATQLYLATTYPGNFFKMPAETTVVVGKTFGDIAVNDNIDFGMGFDLLLFPEVFKNYIHWINDFSNFSYSLDAKGADAIYRGVFNTGIRVDLSTIPAFSKYKFVIDAIVTDALDANRAFSLGAAFGTAVK